MKKLLAAAAILACLFGLTSCSRKSGIADITSIVGISGLVTEKGFAKEDFQDELLGQHRDDVIHAWGEPDGMLSGFWGDIWHLSDESNKQIILYYDKDGIVENIRIAER